MGKSYHMTKSSFTYFFGHFKILSVFVSTNETGHKFHNWSVIHTLWIQQNKLNCRKKWLGVPRRGLFERDYHPAQNWPASFTDTKTQTKLTRYSEFWSGFFCPKITLGAVPNRIWYQWFAIKCQGLCYEIWRLVIKKVSLEISRFQLFHLKHISKISVYLLDINTFFIQITINIIWRKIIKIFISRPPPNFIIRLEANQTIIVLVRGYNFISFCVWMVLKDISKLWPLWYLYRVWKSYWSSIREWL